VEKFRQKGWPEKAPLFTVPFRPGELQGGFNELVISNATTDFTTVSGSYNYFPLEFDQVRFDAQFRDRRGLIFYVLDE